MKQDDKAARRGQNGAGQHGAGKRVSAAGSCAATNMLCHKAIVYFPSTCSLPLPIYLQEQFRFRKRA